MSGPTKGGTPYLKLKKKNVEHPGIGKVKAERDVEAQTSLPSAATKIRLGLRIKQVQVIDTFEIRNKAGGLLNMVRQPANDPIAQDLATTLGLAGDEQWVTYLVDWKPTDGKKFDTTLVLSNYQIHDNGFQVVTVALSHQSQTFANGVYGFGISLIPGKNNTAFRMALADGTAKPAAAKPQTTSASKKKAAPKKKSKRKR